MVSTKRSSSAKGREKSRVFVNDDESDKGSSISSTSGEAIAEIYEEKRAQRMQENMERLKKLGILELSKNLKKSSSNVAPKKKKKLSDDALSARNDPPRRSSRLKDITPVSYAEKRPKGEKIRRIKEINIGIGSNPEVYTEEHEKLLNDSNTPWTLLVDGYDESGQRIYDPIEGKSCHQCRQKTLGHRTKCSKCKSITGQLCGDCLYTRYGENVIEVNENPDWICPVCRDICNCSRCRRVKGWLPTGAIYRQVHARGFKSVAHYLIKASRSEANNEGESNENMISSLDLLPSSDPITHISDLISTVEANVNGSDREDEDELFVPDEDHEDEDDDDEDHEDGDDDHVADSETDD